jgi:hypothetical protein
VSQGLPHGTNRKVFLDQAIANFSEPNPGLRISRPSSHLQNPVNDWQKFTKTGKSPLPRSKIPKFFFRKTPKNPLKNPLVTYGKLGNFLKKDKNSQQKWLGDSFTEESGRKETDSKEGNKLMSMIDVETKSTRRAFSGIN